MYHIVEQIKTESKAQRNLGAQSSARSCMETMQDLSTVTELTSDEGCSLRSLLLQSLSKEFPQTIWVLVIWHSTVTAFNENQSYWYLFMCFR